MRGAAAGYLAVIRLPGAVAVLVPNLVGRLSFATVSLALLFMVQHGTGSYASADTAVALFGVANDPAAPRNRYRSYGGQARPVNGRWPRPAAPPYFRRPSSTRCWVRSGSRCTLSPPPRHPSSVLGDERARRCGGHARLADLRSLGGTGLSGRLPSSISWVLHLPHRILRCGRRPASRCRPCTATPRSASCPNWPWSLTSQLSPSPPRSLAVCTPVGVSSP